MIIIMSIFHRQRSESFYFLQIANICEFILFSNKTGTFFRCRSFMMTSDHFTFPVLSFLDVVSYELERIKVEARQTICGGFGELFVSFERNSRFSNITLISFPLITQQKRFVSVNLVHSLIA